MTAVPPSVIVTGAGAGIGAAIAHEANRRGWIVGVVDRDAGAARDTAAKIGAAAHPLCADVTDPSALDRAFDEFGAASGRPAPDAFVANAGIVRFGPLLDLSVDDWRAVVDVNLTGTFLAARAFARRAIAAGRPGAVVAVTSMNGVAAGVKSGAYGPTKAAVALLTQQMALEWGPHGIRVNAVAPGLIDAGMSAPIYADAEARSARERRVPLGRLGTAADVAAAVMFLLSDDAAYISGVELLVDGAVTPSILTTLPRPGTVDSGEAAASTGPT